MTDERGKLPDFIIAGAQKCGTTTLHRALFYHDDVWVSSPKELNFFSSDERFSKGIESYTRAFAACRSNQLAGESSPEYFHHSDAVKRMAASLPHTKMIILLRDPVDRAYSGYWHSVMYSGETLSFEEAIEAEGDRIQKSVAAKKNYSYLRRGQYARDLKTFFDAFGRERCLVLLSEDYFTNPDAVLRETTAFLGLSCTDAYLDRVRDLAVNTGKTPKIGLLQRFFPVIYKRIQSGGYLLVKYNATEGYAPMADSTRTRLFEYYRESLEELETLLDRDLSIWRREARERIVLSAS